MTPHLAIYIANTHNKHLLIHNLISGKLVSDLVHLKGALFSEITINKYIEEERRHEHFNVETSTNNSLQKSSEGERRKALLHHIIASKPDYIIVDNIFDNLDVTAQHDIVNTFTGLSKQIPIIQISNRKRDVLPFIKKVYQIQNARLVLIKDGSSYNQNSKTTFVGAIPKLKKDSNAENSPLIKFENVSIAYGDRTILKDIFWEVKKGEFWHLMGPNGSGKSTLLSLITGDNVKAYNQNITLFGVKKGSGESVWDIKKKIGYFSSDMLQGFSRADAIGNMIVSGFYDSIGLYQMPTDAQIKLAHQWLHLLGMFEIRKQPFLSLSLGYQRLVLIARAMIKHPPLLILDEPSTGLDDYDVVLFSELINKIAKESDTAILYVSHRKELGLNPNFIYQLTPNKTGSTGKQVYV